LPALPSVATGVRVLKALLCDPDVVGIPSQHVAALVDCADLTLLKEALSHAAFEAEDCLIIYYSGHGCIGRDSHELYLATPATSRFLEASALEVNFVCERLTRSRARKKILILDCCFSGRALGVMASEEDMVRGALDLKGVFALTSAPKNGTADAPEGAQFTAFTGELLAVLRDGIANNRSELLLDDIYDELRNRLARQKFPEPQRMTRDDGGQIALARNRGYVAIAADAAAPAAKDRSPLRSVVAMAQSLRVADLTDNADAQARGTSAPVGIFASVGRRNASVGAIVLGVALFIGLARKAWLSKIEGPEAETPVASAPVPTAAALKIPPLVSVDDRAPSPKPSAPPPEQVVATGRHTDPGAKPLSTTPAVAEVPTTPTPKAAQIPLTWITQLGKNSAPIVTITANHPAKCFIDGGIFLSPTPQAAAIDPGPHKIQCFWISKELGTQFEREQDINILEKQRLPVYFDFDR
jgi:hypothetical protein